MRTKMHDDEVDIDADLVARLVAAQFPRLADLPVREVRSTGTVNAIYRLGERYCMRLPRVAKWADGLERECAWLPRLAPRLSLRIPTPVAMGRPAHGYPFTWAIYGWIEGRPYADDLVDDERRAARELARFVTELRRTDRTGAPRTGRAPLRELDVVTRGAIVGATAVIDGAAATAAWERALAAPEWDATPAWIHTDLLRPNLLVDGGRLCAVIDFGAVGVGDPAADVAAAWNVFGPVGRPAYRAALDIDAGTWERARGYALHQAVMLIPYYRDTNPGLARLGARTIREILADGRT